MKVTIYTFVLGLFAVLSSTAQTNTPKTFNAFFTESPVTYKGILNVHVFHDTYYLEIPYALMGKDFLFASQMLQGSSGNLLYTPSLGVAHFQLEADGKLSLTKPLNAERTSDTTSSIYRILKETTLPTIGSLYPIVAYGQDGQSPIVDITTLLKTSTEWFSTTVTNGIIPAQCDVKRITTVKDRICFNICRGYSYSDEKGVRRIKFLTTECLIRLLPEEKMNIRYANPAVGYQTQNFVDYAETTIDDFKTSIIHRWNLTIAPNDFPTLQKGGKVSPTNPITFYIAPLVPQELRPFIKKGILEWNKAFEQAGLKNALQIKEADEKMDLGAIDALISYSVNYSGVSSTKLVDPRTGEILACRLNIASTFANTPINNYLLQCGNVDKRIVKDMYSPEIIEEILQSMIAKEIGNILGLEPNTRGSAAYSTQQIKDKNRVKQHGYTASILDDMPFNYAARPSDSLPVSSLFPHVGAYDCLAIVYGYKPFSRYGDSQQDRKHLQILVNKARQQKELCYSIANKQNPETQKLDLGTDKIEAAEFGIQNLEQIYPLFEKITARYDKDSWELYKKILIQAKFQYQDYLNCAAAYIGGQYTRYVSKTNPGPVVTYPSQNDTRKAWEFLEKYAFTGGSAFLDPETSIRNNWSIPQRSTERWIENFFNEKLSLDPIKNLLAASEQKDQNVYHVEDFFADIDRIIFKNYNETNITSALQKLIQRFYIQGLTSGIQANGGINALSDYSIIMGFQARKTYQNLQHLAQKCTNGIEKAHYKQLMRLLSAGLVPQKKN